MGNVDHFSKMLTDCFMKTSIFAQSRRVRNFVISGTNFWNPGDDFVRDGVIQILRQTFPDQHLNFHFFDFAADQFPKSKFRGLENKVSAGDLELCRDFIDGVIIAGLSAGHEIKDLYHWVLANGLGDRVFLIGAGYENPYCAEHVRAEPEATLFQKARIIIGRTAQHPNFQQDEGRSYVHLNCPAVLSVAEVKAVTPGKSIQRIGFSIQLPHDVGVVNQTCDTSVHQLAWKVMLDFAKIYQVEIVAHHKSEYFHFLHLLRESGIPVVYSSFYRDLHETYRRYDCVISTRLHSCLYANGHGIPAIVLNDSDRHTHALLGFPWAFLANTRPAFDQLFATLMRSSLSDISEECRVYKIQLLERYVQLLRPAFQEVSSLISGFPEHINAVQSGRFIQGSNAVQIATDYQFDSERKEQLLVRSLVKPGMTILDVGAHVGKYTKLFSLLVGGEGRVFSFEPTPGSAGKLAERILVDCLQNVTLTRKVVCEQVGVVTLHQFPEEYSSWNGLGRPSMEDPRDGSKLVPIIGEIEVEATTLDAFCQAQGIAKVDYLKLDVEGAEIQALRGAVTLLRAQAINCLQFEVSRKMLEGLGTHARGVFQFLGEFGYECHAILEDGQIGPRATDSDAFYDNFIAFPLKVAHPVDLAKQLPIHFFTIVLNGQPFIQHHIKILQQLPFLWHWHIVEGVAELKEDTSWSVAAGGCIPASFLKNCLSIDGTSEYLDELKRAFPDQITVHRRPAGQTWDGKCAMVNAPLAIITDECLLWQLDADELWTTTQIIRCRSLFLAHPEKSAALFFCRYFVGPNLVITSRDTYGNNSNYEWLRVWRYQSGDRWLTHEPPCLGRSTPGKPPIDVAKLDTFSHAQTESMGLVFQHYAYAIEAQVAFKEIYYGYQGAVAQWRRLQSESEFPQRLGRYFSWVRDEAIVKKLKDSGIHRLAPEAWFVELTKQGFNPLDGAERILFVRTDSIGDALLASSMLEPIRHQNPDAKIAVLCQRQVADLYLACPWIDSIICYDRSRLNQEIGFQEILSEITEFQPDVILNSVRSRDCLSDRLTLEYRPARHISIECDLNNISEEDCARAASQYDLVVPSPQLKLPELARHSQFLVGIGIQAKELHPAVWTTYEAESIADAFFLREGLDPLLTLCLWPGAQFDIRVYQGYAEALLDHDGFRVVVMGDESQTNLADDVVSRLGGRALNLCGQTSLLEAAAILRRCRLYIGAESAGAHLACALGVPNVVVLGGGHFGRFMPYSALTSAVALPLECFDCNWHCPHSRAHCVKDLSPEVLSAAIRKALTETSSKPRVYIQPAADWTVGENRPAWQRPERYLSGAEVEIIEEGCLVESTELTVEAQQHVVDAQTLVDRGDTAGAVRALEEARVICPKHADIRIALGHLHLECGDLAGCFQELQAAARIRQNDPLVQVLLASVAIRLNQVPVFERAISRALELDSSFGQAHRLLADLNLEAGRYVEAAREFGLLIQQSPNDISVLLALGKCLTEVGQTEAAEACFARVLELELSNEIAGQNLEVLSRRKKAACAEKANPAPEDPRIERIPCPFCQSLKAELVRRSADIVRCTDCSTVYLRTRPKKEVMEQIYQTYADDGSHMALPKSLTEADRSGLKREYFLKEILEFTQPAGRLLDVGCGWGAFLLNSRQHGFEVEGLEITRKAAGYANSTLQIPVKTSQFLETEFAPDTQSVITMLHVFEHLPYPKQVLDKVRRVLKPGGLFCGIVPNFDSFCSHTLGERWYWLDPTYHYVHYTPETLRRHLEDAGFLVERIYTATGDYGSDPIRKMLEAREAVTLDPVVLRDKLKQIETSGRGEEIRFIARKPIGPHVSEPVEMFGGEGIANPVVTVVVSTYSAEALLRPCLEGLTRQTIFSQIEVIVVDSGSPQNEREIAWEFAKKHSNIRYLRTGRETLYAAWNRGLSFARGRYWANLNTDDSLRDDALAILVAALENHSDCALAYGDTAWTTKPNDVFPSPNIIRTVKYPSYAPVETLFYCITGCLQFWRRDSIQKLGGFDASLRCAGDYHATLKMMAARMNAVHVPEVLSLFFQNTTGLTQASDKSATEHLQMMNQFRWDIDIEHIFQVEPGESSSISDGLATLGLHASKFAVPWEDRMSEHMDFAFHCLHRALELDPENQAAGTSLVALNCRLNRLASREADLVRRWPKMGEWIQQARHGISEPLPPVRHALLGPIYRPAEWIDRPQAAQLIGEPLALIPWICRVEGRHVYLSKDIFPRPVGMRYRPKELQEAGFRLASLLAELPKFYAHFGGAGDALLLLASMYDTHPNAVVLSFPNSIGATRAFFETFPKLGKIYFLPQHAEPFFSIVLRFAVYELRNCLGAGATPKLGYDEEWKAGLDIETNYGIRKSPLWAKAMKRNAHSRKIAVAPKGSLAGMVGSKRNIILPKLWPEVIAHIVRRGFTPVILGVVAEAEEYPVLSGCVDARGESFGGQMRLIGDCAGLVGADSWAKTFSALLELPTIVFEPLRGKDMAAWKDPSDFVFIEPWATIKVVRSMEEFQRAFDVSLTGSPDSTSPVSKSPVVAWEGSFLDFGSLSQVNRELTRALAGSDGFQLRCVNVCPSRNGATTPSPLKELARTLAKKPVDDAGITIRHAWPPNWCRPAHGKFVIIQPWEFGALPQEWVEQARHVDEFWVPSSYVQSVYVNSGVELGKVWVVPNGIDPERFHPEATPLTLSTSKSFRFLFVGGTIYRKGLDVLLQTFLEAFSAADDVCLVIKDFGGRTVYAGQTFEAQIKAAQVKPEAPEILYLKEELPPEALPGLYTACDCLVHPYRGEGFGLPVLEAMACGLPAVVTGGGATDDFATDEFAYRLPAVRQEMGTHLSGLKLVESGWLLEPDAEALRERLRWIAAHRVEARAKGMKASVSVRRDWTWTRAAKIIQQHVQRLSVPREPGAVRPLQTKPAGLTMPTVAHLGNLAAARGLLGQGQILAALNQTVSALEVRPYHPEAFLLLAEICRDAGDFKRAFEFANHARRIAPGWTAAQQFLKSPKSEGDAKIELPPRVDSLLSQDTPRLTVCLITKNEERFLGRCLESIRDVAQQIIVVDTGSTDATREIAAQAGAEVYSFVWCDDFSAARNAGLERATGDWILVLDADEELLEGQREKFLRLLQDSAAIAFRLPLIDEGHEAEGVNYVPRLFRNAPGVYYAGYVHEHVFLSVDSLRQKWGLDNKLGDATLLHHGYTTEMRQSRGKGARNVRLLRKALEETPEDPNLVMNLGLELVRSGDLSEGIKQYDAAFRIVSALPSDQISPEFRETLLTQFCTHLVTTKDYLGVTRVMRSPLARGSGLTATLHWFYGLSCLETKQFAEGASQMRHCLAKRKSKALSPVDKNIFKAGPNHCLALCLVALKQLEAAEKAFCAALQDEPNARAVHLDYARFLAEGGREVEALNSLHQHMLSDPSDPQVWHLGGQIALNNPEFLEFATDWTSEAMKLHGKQPGIVEQRATALLLSGNPEDALPLWKRLNGPTNDSRRAAVIICEILLDQPLEKGPLSGARTVDQEFVGWYRRLLAVNAWQAIQILNRRLASLCPLVPEAVRLLERALAESGAEMIK